MYVVNSTELITVLQKHWRTVSFVAITINFTKSFGLSKDAFEVMGRDLMSDHGFTVSSPKAIVSSMAPGKDLDAMNRTAIQIFADEMEALRARGTIRVGLQEWSRRNMLTATTEAVWGPQNPYRDPAIINAWRTFESGFMTLALFPFAQRFFPKLIKARELLASAFIDYFRKDGHKTASALVRDRYEHHYVQFGLSIEDIGHGEIGNTFAVLGTSAPNAFCFLYHIFSDQQVLADVRCETSALVVQGSNDSDGSGLVCSVDLGDVRTSCPVLMSTFQETLRYRAFNPGSRVLLEDVRLDSGRIVLIKGAMLMMPSSVQHTSIAAWGDDVHEFDHLRFTRKDTGPGSKRPNRTAFRAFGGGHVLCPGRHFASSEIMALGALVALQFDMMPAAGKWVEPAYRTPIQGGLPMPLKDIDVELRPRNPGTEWRVTFSESNKGMGIVSEDAGAE